MSSRRIAALALFAIGCGSDTITLRDGDGVLTLSCGAARLRVPPGRGYTTLAIMSDARGGDENTTDADAIPGDSLAARFAREGDSHWRQVALGVWEADSVGPIRRALERPARDSMVLFVSTRAPMAAYRFPLWRARKPSCA